MSLLDDQDAAEAIAAVLDIVHDLRGQTFDDSVLRPLLRIRHAMFYAQVARANVIDTTADAELCLEEGVGLLGRTPISDRLHGGIVGVGWTLGRLVAADTADHLCDSIDAHLLTKLAAPWEGEYELLRGLAGLGLYALERQHRASGRELAVRVLDELERISERSPRGVAWFTTPAMMKVSNAARIQPVGTYCLGLSHGIAGVVGVLARYLDRGIERARCTALLEGAVEFLLSVAPPRAPSRFPFQLDAKYRVVDDGKQLAWCHGDLGIALALQSAARTLDRPDWASEVTSLALQMAARSFDDAGTADAALCHGAAGIAHGFHRLFRATGDEACREASRRWFHKTLAMRHPGTGFGGYQVATRAVDSEEVIWSDDNTTLLSGAPGIGLALLAAVTGEEPDWDAVFLFDCGDWN